MRRAPCVLNRKQTTPNCWVFTLTPSLGLLLLLSLLAVVLSYSCCLSSLVVMTDSIAAQPHQAYDAAHLRGGMPDDLLEQVLCFLTPTQALRCSRTSRAFLRAALASLERANTWPADPGTAVPCRTAYHGGSSGSGLVGTPCLDLRDAGDAIDSRALLAVLGRAFVKPGGSSNVAAAAAARAGVHGEGGGEGGTGSYAARKPAVLKGLAVRSAVIQDEVSAVQAARHIQEQECIVPRPSASLRVASPVPRPSV